MAIIGTAMHNTIVLHCYLHAYLILSIFLGNRKHETHLNGRNLFFLLLQKSEIQH